MNVLQTKHILLTRERCGKKISTWVSSRGFFLFMHKAAATTMSSVCPEIQRRHVFETRVGFCFIFYFFFLPGIISIFIFHLPKWPARPHALSPLSSPAYQQRQNGQLNSYKREEDERKNSRILERQQQQQSERNNNNLSIIWAGQFRSCSLSLSFSHSLRLINAPTVNLLKILIKWTIMLLSPPPLCSTS